MTQPGRVASDPYDFEARGAGPVKMAYLPGTVRFEVRDCAG